MKKGKSLILAKLLMQRKYNDSDFVKTTFWPPKSDPVVRHTEKMKRNGGKWRCSTPRTPRMKKY